MVRVIAVDTATGRRLAVAMRGPHSAAGVVHARVPVARTALSLHTAAPAMSPWTSTGRWWTWPTRRGSAARDRQPYPGRDHDAERPRTCPLRQSRATPSVFRVATFTSPGMRARRSSLACATSRPVEETRQATARCPTGRLFVHIAPTVGAGWTQQASRRFLSRNPQTGRDNSRVAAATGNNRSTATSAPYPNLPYRGGDSAPSRAVKCRPGAPCPGGQARETVEGVAVADELAVILL